MLSMGATGKLLTDWVGNGRLTKYGVRFVNQVWPGDDLTATATVDAIREEAGQHFADFTVTTVNQDGKPVVTGSATAKHRPLNRLTSMASTRPHAERGGGVDRSPGEGERGGALAADAAGQAHRAAGAGDQTERDLGERDRRVGVGDDSAGERGGLDAAAVGGAVHVHRDAVAQPVHQPRRAAGEADHVGARRVGPAAELAEVAAAAERRAVARAARRARSSRRRARARARRRARSRSWALIALRRCGRSSVIVSRPSCRSVSTTGSPCVAGSCVAAHPLAMRRTRGRPGAWSTRPTRAQVRLPCRPPASPAAGSRAWPQRSGACSTTASVLVDVALTDHGIRTVGAVAAEAVARPTAPRAAASREG